MDLRRFRSRMMARSSAVEQVAGDVPIPGLEDVPLEIHHLDSFGAATAAGHLTGEGLGPTIFGHAELDPGVPDVPAVQKLFIDRADILTARSLL